MEVNSASEVGPSAGLMFDSIARQSISDGLRLFLGASGLELLFKGYKLAEAMKDTGRLHALLRSVFKDRGAAVLEREIARELCERIDERFSDGEGRSPEYFVHQAKNLYTTVTQRVENR